MGEREQVAFRRRNLAVDGISKLILSCATLKGRKRPAGRERLERSDQRGFPRWVRISDAVAWS
jgi:hypothetical protein